MFHVYMLSSINLVFSEVVPKNHWTKLEQTVNDKDYGFMVNNQHIL